MDLPNELQTIVYSFMHDFELAVFAPERSKLTAKQAFWKAIQHNWIPGMHVLRYPDCGGAVRIAAKHNATFALLTLINWGVSNKDLQIAFNIAAKRDHIMIMKTIAQFVTLDFKIAQRKAIDNKSLRALICIRNLGYRDITGLAHKTSKTGDCKIADQIMAWGGIFTVHHLQNAIERHHNELAKKIWAIIPHPIILRSTYFVAAGVGNIEMIKLLLNDRQPLNKMIESACEYGQSATILYLISRGGIMPNIYDWNYIFWRAAEADNFGNLILAHEQGANNYLDAWENTTDMHCAAYLLEHLAA